jgi:hypothetical protein
MQGRRSLAYEYAYGTPASIPSQPQPLEAYTLHNAIKIKWGNPNTELDFDHYAILRDGIFLPLTITDTVFIDDDPFLGTEFHTYMIFAVDSDGNYSDTVGIEPVTMRAASLRQGEILAVNRSGSNSIAMVDETVTGEFMREALQGMSFVYFSDTTAVDDQKADLMKMIDYELVIIGAEGARQDEIGGEPNFGGILDDIGYYLSIGGKAIIFGRWGDISIASNDVDTVYYDCNDCDAGYTDYFNIQYRVIPRSYIDAANAILHSDMIGAHSQVAGFPELTWDSLATSNHSGYLSNITGIPCPSYAILTGANPEVIYTYNSSNDSLLTEGRSVAWQSSGGIYNYVFFDIPLSFMERSTAVEALRQAIGDMGVISDIEDNPNPAAIPRSLILYQNYPNPFNPTTIIEFYNPETRSARVTLEVFNIVGQRVRTLFDGTAQPGFNRIAWDGRDQSNREVASGVYFYRLTSDRSSITRKMLLMK